jgi:hypothetical protein
MPRRMFAWVSISRWKDSSSFRFGAIHAAPHVRLGFHLQMERQLVVQVAVRRVIVSSRHEPPRLDGGDLVCVGCSWQNPPRPVIVTIAASATDAAATNRFRPDFTRPARA